MHVVIAGAHGKVAMPLIRRLHARGDTVVGLIRNPDHADDVEALGARPLACDLETATVEEIASGLAGATAAVFAAGAGPGSGPERKLTMDRDGAIKLLHAAEQTGIRRYLVISAVGAESPPPGDDVFAVYLRAKAEADAAVQQSPLDWTILRPGRLTDDPARDQVQLSAEPFRSEITREDVAVVIDALLREPRAARRIIYAGSGEESVEQAVESVL
jgi:uncharacterized protein YbjT (DUF2867 family)